MGVCFLQLQVVELSRTGLTAYSVIVYTI
jgi:hypothetical protein